MVLLLGIGPPFVNPGDCSVGQHLDIHIRRWHRHSGQRPSRSAVCFPSRGRARWVGGRRWRLSRRRRSQESIFLFPLVSLLGTNYAFLKGVVLFYWILVDMFVAKQESTPCYHDAYSVGTPEWAFWGKGWQNHCRSTFSPLCKRVFWLTKGLCSFWEDW